VQGPADERAAGLGTTPPAPRRNRTIIGLGLLLCVVGAIAAAYLLGALDRIGLLH
jgi:hypothetical protein